MDWLVKAWEIGISIVMMACGYAISMLLIYYSIKLFHRKAILRNEKYFNDKYTDSNKQPRDSSDW